jgi:hypothetical protein
VCGIALPVGAKAQWDAETRTTACPGCTSSPHNPTDVRLDPQAPQFTAAGVSARREYDKRHARREQRIDQRWGRLAGVAKFLSDDPQSTRAWAKGSDGERRLAALLNQLVGDRAVFLHDRKVPRSRRNIDHIAVAASGVWVIDAKNYAGRVEQRDVGRWFTTDKRLYVGGRDRTKAVDGLAWQVEAVRVALDEPDVPVHPALCFIGADWNVFAKPFDQGGVWVTWAKKLAEVIAAAGPLTTAQVTNIAEQLAVALPAA